MTAPHESAPDHRSGPGDFDDRLATEYAGAVPPGQLLSLVLRVARATGGTLGSDRLDLSEQIVRQRLTERLAHAAAVGHSAG